MTVIYAKVIIVDSIKFNKIYNEFKQSMKKDIDWNEFILDAI